MTFYTVEELSKILKCNKRYIYREIEAGALEHHRLKSGMIRVSQEQFDRYMGERCES